MYHSVVFDLDVGSSYDTYAHFHMVPTKRPVIALPEVKTKTIDIPGANGEIDLTDSLMGYPALANRTGSIEFAVLTENMERAQLDWAGLYSKIANSIHGKKCKLVLEDDQDWYYHGRVSMGSWTPDSSGKWPTVTINYNLEPYKIKRESTSFQYSVSSSSWTFLQRLTYREIGIAPVIPAINFSSSNMGIRVSMSSLGYSRDREHTASGTYTDPSIFLYDYNNNGVYVYGKGSGNITFTLNERSL